MFIGFQEKNEAEEGRGEGKQQSKRERVKR